MAFKMPTKTVEMTAQLLKRAIKPCPEISSRDFGALFQPFADCKVLLIGDASHGTSEFYAARAAITKYMVAHHGFNIVAVEADWPDAEAVDRHVRHRQSYGHSSGVDRVPHGPDPPFTRFPTWMWRNQEVSDFVSWLREHNKGTHAKKAVGFYGLDLYSMGTSMRAVLNYLERVDGKMAKVARIRYGRLMPWARDPHEYGLETLTTTFGGYEREVVEMLKDLLAKRLEYQMHHLDGEEFHSAEQNARVVADAERYYKAMYYASEESWNLRDTHMFETLVRILKHRGPHSKAIVWAHNSHVGDARWTDMLLRGELNIGQLCKETFGAEQALILGCGTHGGTVAAAENWDGDMQVMNVNPSLPGSYEEVMHAVGVERFMVDMRKGVCDEEVRRELMKKRLERFIGVIYRPDTERRSHYMSAVLPSQFDGFLWFDRTRAVEVFERRQPHGVVEMDETWPFGL